MKRIAIVCQKGGTGKTTTAVNVGAGLAATGKRVLLVDLDPQSCASASLGIGGELEHNACHWLKGEVSAKDVTKNTAGLDLIPGGLELSGVDLELSRTPGREILLKERLAECRGYDFALIDCPPSLGLLTVNALVAADVVYIPVETTALALRGLGKLTETIDIVKRRLNTKLVIGGVLATRYDGRKNLSKDVTQQIKKHFGGKMFATVIRENVALAEAPSYGQDIFRFKPRSHGAEDYKQLCREILRKG
jgi:chromosome partitioning protein